MIFQLKYNTFIVLVFGNFSMGAPDEQYPGTCCVYRVEATRDIQGRHSTPTHSLSATSQATSS